MKKSIGIHNAAYPLPVYVIGSYDQKGKPNIMTASWAGICCSQPPCIAVSIRPNRYSYNNIIDNQAFTVNIPAEEHVKQSDYVGVYSGRKENKFESTGLTAVDSEIVKAPYIEEFPISIICKMLKIVEIGVHTQFIGEILDVKADENVLNEEGLPIFEKVNPIMYDIFSKSYYKAGSKISDGFLKHR